MKTYRYDELSNVAKERALEVLHHRYAPDHGWWEFVYEAIKEFCSELCTPSNQGYSGYIDVKGFDSDGGWICWSGSLTLTQEGLENMAKNYGNDYEQEIIKYMQDTLAMLKLGRVPLGLENVEGGGNALWVNYGASYRRQAVDVESSILTYANECPLNDELFIRLVQIKNDLSDMFVKWLGDEYDYITTDEYVIETADVNDIMFDEEGELIDD